jgi:hypothetical protein
VVGGIIAKFPSTWRNFATALKHKKEAMTVESLIATESRLEGGVDRQKLKFTTLNTLQAGVSVRIKSESGREGETNQPRNKADDTIICFTEVRF